METAEELIYEFLRRFDQEVAERFKNVELWEIEVPNAPLYADYFGLSTRAFCRTINFPCDVGPEDLIVERLAGLTGWRPGYFRYLCKSGKIDDEDKELCRILDELEEALKREADPAELLARLDAALEGKKIAAIITEGNVDWDVYTVFNPEDEERTRVDELYDFVRKVDAVLDALKEEGKHELYDMIYELAGEDLEKLDKIIRHIRFKAGKPVIRDIEKAIMLNA